MEKNTLLTRFVFEVMPALATLTLYALLVYLFYGTITVGSSHNAIPFLIMVACMIVHIYVGIVNALEH